MANWTKLLFCLNLVFLQSGLRADNPTENTVVEGSSGEESPPDSDKDGVMDRLDQCLKTPLGSKVNRYGCADSEKLEFNLFIDFLPGDTTVGPEFHEAIEGVSDFLRKFPDTIAVVEGHTDSVGSLKSNITLSQKRAEAVMNYLIKRFGVASKRLSAVGFGPTQKIASNATESGRRKNRRVVVKITTPEKK